MRKQWDNFCESWVAVVVVILLVGAWLWFTSADPSNWFYGG
jgi:hypothetical protein